jgi:site-specific recombinase XerD
MPHRYFADPSACRRLQDGPLGSHMSAVAAHLLENGYAEPTAQEHLRLVADLSRWLDRRRLRAHHLNEALVARFLKDRPRYRCGHRGKAAFLRALLRRFREIGIAPTPVPPTSSPSSPPAVERNYAQYLYQERGLSHATVVNYCPVVRSLLSLRFGKGPVQLGRLSPLDGVRLILKHSQTLSPTRTKLTVTALRSFLRFLFLRGEIKTDLAAGLPTVPNWRLSTLPKFLDPKEVRLLLKACDRRTLTGQRDYAVLLLLARLGLRAGEVVAMTLDDLDWKAGELTVRGKGSQLDRLPILPDVGKALVTYLRHGRPRCLSRQVFVCMKAPRRGFSSSVAVCTIVRRAINRAGLHPVHKGAHLLRHSLATQMIRRGATLSEIGEVLRHRLPQTTEIYAKVDVASLRSLARRWPGGAR